MKKLDKKAQDISKKVNCGYLRLSFGISVDKTKLNQTDILIECHNLQCGPQHYCAFLDNGKCKYRSVEVKPRNLYHS